jgi:trk system potassium uptake protein TrkA
MAGAFLVIGLGQFGSAVARELVQRGAEVVAVDKDEETVNRIAPLVTRALVMDATDEDSIKALEPDQMDAAICGIGEDAKDASILVTTLLKEYGAPRVLAREIGQLHARILFRVGADEVVNPETEVARQMAQRLLIPTLHQLYDLGDGLVMAELPVPEPFVGQDLQGLEIQKRFRVIVVALRSKKDAPVLMVPSPEMVLEGGSYILAVGAHRDLEFLSKGSA